MGKQWYNDPTILTYVATYTNEKQMQKEIEAAYQRKKKKEGFH